jgi:hypothetical protein
VEVTIHTTEIALVRRVLGRDAPTTFVGVQGKRVALLSLRPDQVTSLNTTLALEAKHTALGAPTSPLPHPLILWRAHPDDRKDFEKRSSLPACWTAFFILEYADLFGAVRMVPVESGGHGLAFAPRGEGAHAELLTVAEAEGLRVMRGADLARAVGTIRMVGGGAVSSWPAAKQELAKRVGALVGQTVRVYDRPDGLLATCSVAHGDMHPAGVTLDMFPEEVLGFGVQWRALHFPKAAQAGPRASRAARLAGLG